MRLQRYILTGIITLIPIAVTWLVFDFILGLMIRLGSPAARFFAGIFETQEYAVAEWIQNPVGQSVLAIILTLTAFYLLGFVASRVVGRRLLALVHYIFEKLPLVQTIYGSTKRLLEVLDKKPERAQRVVLISFPSSEMKALGFLTRVLRDRSTGEELAAVYVPTTPNPTSGYLEIVPLKYVTQTDMSFDEAMSFIVTGGAVGPEVLDFSSSAPGTLPAADGTPAR